MAKYDSLDKVEVVATTDKAVKVAWDRNGVVNMQWIPRSVCEDGDRLSEGDTDVIVETWFIDKEGLPT